MPSQGGATRGRTNPTGEGDTISSPGSLPLDNGGSTASLQSPGTDPLDNANCLMGWTLGLLAGWETL